MVENCINYITKTDAPNFHKYDIHRQTKPQHSLLLHDDGGVDKVPPRAAVLVRGVHAQQTSLPSLLPQLPVHVPCRLPPARAQLVIATFRPPTNGHHQALQRFDHQQTVIIRLISDQFHKRDFRLRYCHLDTTCHTPQLLPLYLT